MTAHAKNDLQSHATADNQKVDRDYSFTKDLSFYVV